MTEQHAAEQAAATPAPAPSAPVAQAAPVAVAPAAAEPAPKGGWLRFIPGFKRRTATDHLQQAQRFVERGNLTQALKAYEQALESDAGSTRAHQGIALLLIRRGGREYLRAALAHILEAVRVDPYDPQNYRINALVFQRLGNKKHMQIELRCMA